MEQLTREQDVFDKNIKDVNIETNINPLSKIDDVKSYVEKLTQSITDEKQIIGDNCYIDEFDVVRRKVVKERKVDIVRLHIDDVVNVKDENKRDYITEIGHRLSIDERRDVARLTGEMTQSLRDSMKEKELHQSFLQRNMNTGVAGYLNRSHNKVAKVAGTLIGGLSTKLSHLSFNIGNFFGLDKSTYLLAAEKKVDDLIQSMQMDDKEVKSIRAEAMMTVVDRSKNLTQDQKNNFTKVYQNLRLESEAQVKQVEMMNQKKSMIDNIKSLDEDVISSASLKKLARGAKTVAKYAMVSVSTLATKLALNSVVPFVGWVAGGAVAGSVREIVSRSSYSYDAWKKEIDSLMERGEVAQAQSLCEAIIENNWLVGERVEYQKMSRDARELAESKAKSSDSYYEEIQKIKQSRDDEHNRKIGKSAAIGAAFGGVAGLVHTVGGILFGTPAYAADEAVHHTTPKHVSLDHVYEKDGSINFDNLRKLTTNEKVLYNQDVKQVITDNPGYFSDKSHLQKFLNMTGKGHVGFSKEQLVTNLTKGNDGVPEYTEFVSYEDGVKHVKYDYSNVFGPNDKNKPVIDAMFEKIPGKKGYAIIVDEKTGINHEATDIDKLGDIVDNKGNVLAQHPGEIANLYNSGNSCDNLYVAVKYYHDVDGMNKFMTNLGVNPEMVVRGTDGQTVSQWLMQNGYRFNDTNIDLMKWIMYRDPAGAKEVMDVICDETKNYHFKKELYEFYLDIPKDSPKWAQSVDTVLNSNPVPAKGDVDLSGVVATKVGEHKAGIMNERLQEYLGQTKVGGHNSATNKVDLTQDQMNSTPVITKPNLTQDQMQDNNVVIYKVGIKENQFVEPINEKEVQVVTELSKKSFVNEKTINYLSQKHVNLDSSDDNISVK